MTLGEVWLVVIGAGLGFVVSIGTTIVERCLEKIGKLKIYYTYNCLRDNAFPFGFIESEDNYLTFSVPIICEIQNTSRATRVIRDLNVLLYNNGTRVCEAVQIVRTRSSVTTNSAVTEKRQIDYGGEKNAYSFVVIPQSIQKQICSFLYQIPANEVAKNQFDEIRLRYYNENDKEHIFPMQKIDNCWKLSKLKGNDGWSVVK